MDEVQVVGGQFRRTMLDGDDPAITKSLVGTVLVEVMPAFLLVIEEVSILSGKYPLDLFIPACFNGGELSMLELSVFMSTLLFGRVKGCCFLVVLNFLI